MAFKAEIDERASRTPEEQKKELFLKQKELLNTFLAQHAITQQQYDKSLHDMMDKMGMGSHYI